MVSFFALRKGIFGIRWRYNFQLLRNMLRNKHMKDKNIRKLTRIAKRSIGITLPIELVRELGWREKQKVVVKKRGNGLLIEDWKK